MWPLENVIESYTKHVYSVIIYICVCVCVSEGKSSNSYIGPQAPFTNGSAFEKEQMTGKVLEWMVASGKSRRPRSERVILLGPDEYQSSRHSGDLDNLPGDSNIEDRLQVDTEMIKIQKYLREKLPPPH